MQFAITKDTISQVEKQAKGVSSYLAAELVPLSPPQAVG
jgi:hypothetical protein